MSLKDQKIKVKREVLRNKIFLQVTTPMKANCPQNKHDFGHSRGHSRGISLAGKQAAKYKPPCSLFNLRIHW